MRLEVFKIYEKAVKPEWCDKINDNFQHMREGMVGIEDSVLNRTDRISNVAALSNNDPIAEYLFNLCTLTNNILRWDLDITGLEDLQLTEYRDEGHYGWHTDCDPFVKVGGVHRKVTAVLMLTGEYGYTGGDLQFEGMDLPKLKKGDVIVFPSVLKHRVTPVESGLRRTLVCWTNGPYFK